MKNIPQEKKFITLPYADDFCLITTNKRTHQKLINEIDENIESMTFLFTLKWLLKSG